MFCVKCGMELPNEEIIFCPKCGQKVIYPTDFKAAQGAEQPTPSPKRNLIAAAAVVAEPFVQIWI